MVRLETDNETAKTLIIGSQGRLEQDIRLAGIKLARVDVEVQRQWLLPIPGFRIPVRSAVGQNHRQDQDRRSDRLRRKTA